MENSCQRPFPLERPTPDIMVVWLSFKNGCMIFFIVPGLEAADQELLKLRIFLEIGKYWIKTIRFKIRVRVNPNCQEH